MYMYNGVARTWQMTADMVDLLCILSTASRTIGVRFVDQNLNTAATTTALFTTLLLQTATHGTHHIILLANT